jgi:hypothetical protein
MPRSVDRGIRPRGSRGGWDIHTWGELEPIPATGSCQNQIGASRGLVRSATRPAPVQRGGRANDPSRRPQRQASATQRLPPSGVPVRKLRTASITGVIQGEIRLSLDLAAGYADNPEAFGQYGSTPRPGCRSPGLPAWAAVVAAGLFEAGASFDESDDFNFGLQLYLDGAAGFIDRSTGQDR